jgi:hypothetical protein
VEGTPGVAFTLPVEEFQRITSAADAAANAAKAQ